ncbi:three-Cys-motif partner protein TcmP [Longimicrobium sp.]|uniref:three-Cys-motif partner protein TcmP n=1 Tax=Longimicrobium sp. TaxID=2029185 RepID=UPI002CEE5B6E|nr:three-Cys-motif partner protein TcmP [Longimicrobium sp.]HSU15556.1 three-Cys-motif partner protein TcmP [Longimicrobium sp.]
MTDRDRLSLFKIPEMPPVRVQGRERRNGRHALQKLEFLNRFLPPALLATRSKVSRHYVDLFAGQGYFRDEEGRVHEGSALRALSIGAEDSQSVAFTDATLVNLFPEHAQALAENIEKLCATRRCRVPQNRIELIQGDANEAVPRILARIHPRAYVFVFADPENPGQLPWETVKALRSQGHESVDLYLLFPLDMAVIRMMAWDRVKLEPTAAALTRFYGTDEWRAVVERRVTDRDRERCRKELEDLYMQGLRGLGWKHVSRAREVKRAGNHRLYQMLFATNHPVADNLAKWEGRESQLGFI